ncbi:FAD binding domain-containing protein [Rostrohypoxylon terebratum]|nr:FAD binding domain-containing protein [Rostrohypoxylon terebratum]
MITVAFPIIAATLAAGLHIGAAPRSNISDSDCRCFPGDACWPTSTQWAAFNHTVGGRLVATIPIASVCHENDFVAYDAGACANLQAVWNYPQTHYVTSSSPMAPFFANASCDPFTAPSDQCVIGAYVQYAVNATCAEDYKATIAFAAKNNIRLVIRNTGHDYFGKSTGAGALALWTHHLKDIEFIANYTSSAYTGKAFKFGAGVQIFEAYAAADAAGVTVAGGSCDTVGLVGGYTQGGGHGPLNSQVGLGADQVLEWEVVTAAGEHLVATPTANEDLYWALSGGGGGTYAAVLSVTLRAHENFNVSGAVLIFTNTGSDDAFFGAVKTFLMSLPALADAGSWSSWLLAQSYFVLQPLFAPGLDKETLQQLLDPTIASLNESGIPYEYQIAEFDTFYEGFQNLIPFNNISGYNFGGRLIPRSLVEDDSSASQLMDAIKFITSNGGGIAGNHINASKFPTGGIKNSVNPIWRSAIFDAVLGLPYDYENFTANFEIQQKMTDTLMPALEAVTPGGGSYINEADFRQPDWQTAFYGVNYDTLRDIKKKYDPEDLFYGLTAVGSDEWAVQADGRLCRS